MNFTLLIARKDLRSYFHSPLAYVIVAIFLLLVGWMFFNLLSFFKSLEYSPTPRNLTFLNRLHFFYTYLS